MPYAHNYRLDFQDYINSTYQSNIIIGSLHMDWKSSGPSMIANNVSFLQTDGAEVFIAEVDFHLDFWRSLQQLNLVTKALTLEGVKVFVDETLINQTADNQQLTMLDNVTDLFLQRINRFSLINSQVIYRTEKNERTFLISQLNWLNRGEHHKAEGQVIIDGLTSNNLNISLAVKGQKFKEMQGMLYVEANQVNITPWLDKVFAIKNEDTHSSINFDAWLSISQGEISKVQVDIGETQIAWQHLANIQTFDIQQGQLLINNIIDNQNYSLSTSPLTFSSNKRLWQPLSIELTAKNNQYNGYISSIDTEGIAQLIPLFTDNKTVRELLYGLAPKGLVENLFWQIRDEKVSAHAEFSQLSLNYSNGIPSINNLSGEILYREQQMLMKVEGNEGYLDFKDHFIKPISYQTLAASVSLFFQEKGVLAYANEIKLLSEELTLTGELAIDARNNLPISMALLADIQKVDAKNAPHYYPQKLMGNSLINYLNSSLVSGHVTQAQVLFNGPLADFPFTDHQGVFTVDAELTDSLFKFNEQWPAIENFHGNLNFTNNSMLITGRSGFLKGIDVTGVTAQIDELVGSQLLLINADFNKTQASAVTSLMQQSPLKQSVGSVLEQVKIGDNISGSFALTIPLEDSTKTEARGTVNFANNDILLQNPEMNFEQVNGQLTFVNDVITTKDIALMWRGMPLTLDVIAKSTQDFYQTDININANWPQNTWQKQLPEKLTQYGEGSLEWQGELTLKNAKNGEFSYELSVLSDLNTTQLNLPEPFKKASKEKRSVFAKAKGDNHRSTIDAVVGEHMNFYGVLEHDLVAFSRAHLILGQEDMLLPLSGFHITANLIDANLTQWQPFVNDIIDSVSEFSDQNLAGDGVPLLAKPQRIRGNIGKLNVLDEVLDDVAFTMSDQQAWWLLELNSEQVRADIKFYPNWLEQGLSIDADFINIPRTIATSTTQDLDEEQIQVIPILEKTEQEIIEENRVIENVFNHIPPVVFSCKHCQYNGLDLGQVNFQMKRGNDNTILVDNFVAKRQDNNINFDLKWQKQVDHYTTSIKGKLSIDDLEQEFKQLGFASLIKDSGMEATYDITWRGAPYQWNVATLNGDFETELNDGYLADVDDKGLRIFSVLSLQSLVRKLTLDFRDIFSDGMFYSEIKANAHIKDGVLYTDNAKMQGAAGDLSIKGNTDLVVGNLDYRMSYKPNFSASLPAIAWIATLNPVTFLGALALDEVLISKVWSEFNFELTGNVDEPNLREVNRKSQNISVGRSTPPQIVEIDENSQNNTTSQDSNQTEELNIPDKTDG
ncbi:DUF3971 domain-containing protein [Thalassotalea profundi]|uniref:DUF3971 domain-containing protein n=1 Tax=Thalassotalea profundi TaxID=2036687 RepID=A0ABQ3J5B1_9GAMM|nr:DUF3971 domain-containing protein [Thalassotalea profundi]